MQKNNLFFLNKSKALLASSCLALSLTLLASSTQVLGSGRPPGRDGREDTRARLAKKIQDKKLRKLEEFLTRIDEANIDFPHTELPASILTTLADRVISEDEKSQIQQGFIDAHLNPAEIKTIQETFLISFDSGLEYIRATSSRLNSEREYICGRNPDFNIGEAFGTDLVKLTSILRKDFIVKVQPFAKAGIKPMEKFRENFSVENPEDLARIVRMYYGLVRLAQANWEGSNNTLTLLNSIFPDPLINKKARILLSSIYDEGILEALETAQKLLPYVQIIKSVLRIPELPQLTDYAEVIHKNVRHRLTNFKRGRLISPEILEKIRAKQKVSQNTDQSLRATTPESTIEEISQASSSSTIPSASPTPTPLEIEYPTFVIKEDLSQASPPQEIYSSSLDLVAPEPDISEISSLTHIPLHSTDDSPAKIKPVLERKDREEAKFSLGGGAFKTFSNLLSKTYKGSIEKVVILFESLGGKVNEGRSGSRVKFELPHFATQSTVMLDVFSPQDEDVLTSPSTSSPRKKSQSRGSKAARSKVVRSKPASRSTASSSTDLPKRQEVVLHSPHKHGSKKLAPYHVNDIRDMLLRAGFTEERVIRRES
ncbi:MAG: hypothetical protein K2X28_04545 [Alphaproteobacteria bacterium]|nr:hypothetical protein [Alphaproteobacteria bacterium]